MCETLIDCLLHALTPPTKDLVWNTGMWPDWELNWQPRYPTHWATRSGLFFLAPNYHSIVLMYHNLFSYSPTGARSAYSRFGAIMNKIVTNIHIQIFMCMYQLTYRYILISGIAELSGRYMINFVRECQFSTVVAPLCIPTSIVGEF